MHCPGGDVKQGKPVDDPAGKNLLAWKGSCLMSLQTAG